MSVDIVARGLAAGARGTAELAALRAWLDDATATGRIRTEILADGWSPQPFLPQRTYLAGLNGANVPNLANALATSEIGARTGYFASTAGGSAPSGQYCELHWKFTGDRFGLIFDLSAAYNGTVGCLIDGVAYPVISPIMMMPDTQQSFAQLPVAPYAYVADDLGPGVHHARIILPAGPTVRSWLLLGYLVDANAGYVPNPRGVNVNRQTVAVTTTPASFPSGADTAFRAFRGILFSNVTASAVSVAVQTAGGTTIWSRSVPANDTVVFDPLGFLWEPVKIVAAATGINATLIGSN